MNNLNTRRIEDAAARLNPAQRDVRSLCLVPGYSAQTPSSEKRTGEQSPLTLQGEAKTGRYADPKSVVGAGHRAKRPNNNKEA